MTIDPTVEAEPIDSLERKRSLEAAIGTRREAVLVVNSRSRRGRQLYRRAKRLLRECGIALALTYPVRCHAPCSGWASAAVSMHAHGKRADDRVRRDGGSHRQWPISGWGAGRERSEFGKPRSRDPVHQGRLALVDRAVLDDGHAGLSSFDR